jgi:hypothetical protein
MEIEVGKEAKIDAVEPLSGNEEIRVKKQPVSVQD